ncbi:hypothetical protein [Alkalimonas amylolytica]|nr:hypothetical protein [Alkalimonas amylolytica]
MMLNIYHRLARLLQPAFWLILLLAAGSGLVFFWQVLGSDQPHQSTVLFWLLVMLALLGCLLVIKLFASPAPSLDGQKGFLSRLKIRLIRLGYSLLAVMTSLIWLAIMVLALRVGFGALLRLILGQ